MRRLGFLLLGVSLAALPALAADTVYVKTPGTTVHREAAGTSPVVATMKVGTSLSVLRRDGKWMEVESEDAPSGWVFAPKTTRQRPDTSDPVWDLLGAAPDRTNEASTATAIRGLSEIAEAHAGRTQVQPRHVNALKKLEAMEFSDAQIDAFLKQGQLAEYAQ